MTAAPAPDKLGILLRVGLFVILGWLGVMVFPQLMLPLAGIMVTSALSTFAAAAVANAVVVRIYERGRLSDLGLGWTNTSLREFSTGVSAGAGAAVVILAGPLVTGAATFEQVSPSSAEHTSELQTRF